jgi:hypothetical protein
MLGSRVLIPAGLVLAGAVAAWIAAGSGVGSGAYQVLILPAGETIGIGSDFVFSAVANAAIFHREHSFVGVASAVASSFPQVGAAVGGAVLGAVSPGTGVNDFVGPIGASAAVLLADPIVSFTFLRSGPLHAEPGARSSLTRIGIGANAAACHPAPHRASTRWCPSRERNGRAGVGT